MSLIDRMKEGFLIQFGIMPRTLRLRSLLAATRSIKSSSSMRQTIPLPTYNSFLERVLRSSPTTVDSSSLATTRIKSSNPSTPGVLWSNLASKVRRNLKFRQRFSIDLYPSWTKNGLKLIRKFSLNSSTNTSPIGEESSTSVNDTQ